MASKETVIVDDALIEDTCPKMVSPAAHCCVKSKIRLLKSDAISVDAHVVPGCTRSKRNFFQGI